MVVVEAVREGGALQRPPVQEIVSQTRSLPSSPVILTRIMEMIRGGRCDIRKWEDLVRQDQSLSCRVVAAANTARSGLGRKIGTIARAMGILGSGKIRECCLEAGLIGLSDHDSPSSPEEMESLRKHSLATAEIAVAVALRSGKVEPESAFTAGLLHDLGKVVLMAHPARTGRSVRGGTWRETELILGFDHQELGLALAEHWGLPPVLTEVVARHHCPSPSITHAELVAAVHVADCLAGSGDDTPPEAPLPQAMDRLGLNPGDLRSCLEESASRH